MAEEKRLSIIEHLEEFRSRLIISLIAILVTTSLAYVFSDAILYYLRLPAGDIKLQAFSPMDGFMIRFRVALYGGIALAAPIWVFQLLQYLSPGMTKEEKKYIIPGVSVMVILFFLGNLFGYFMLSNMMAVMFTMFGSELNYLPSADQYISFVVYFLVAVGIAFEMPMIVLILVRLGIVSPEFLRKQRKISYFILFVFAELITPVADPFVAPMVVMAPMVLLFELALFVSRFIVPKKAAPVPATPKRVVPPTPPTPPPAPPSVPAMPATETILPPSSTPAVSPSADTPTQPIDQNGVVGNDPGPTQPTRETFGTVPAQDESSQVAMTDNSVDTSTGEKADKPSAESSASDDKAGPTVS